MASKKGVKYELPAELLDRAAKAAKRKAFQKDLPIAILEGGKVVLVDKNNRKR